VAVHLCSLRLTAVRRLRRSGALLTMGLGSNQRERHGDPHLELNLAQEAAARACSGGVAPLGSKKVFLKAAHFLLSFIPLMFQESTFQFQFCVSIN
jgi:hypothetical protein